MFEFELFSSSLFFSMMLSNFASDALLLFKTLLNGILTKVIEASKSKSSLGPLSLLGHSLPVSFYFCSSISVFLSTRGNLIEPAGSAL